MTNKIAENVDVYIKMTSTGNIYFGFIGKGKTISRTDKRYWTNLPIYNIDGHNIDLIINKMLLVSDEHRNFVCNDLKTHVLNINDLSPKKLYLCDDSYVIKMCFECFHKDGHWNTNKNNKFLCTGTNFRDYTTKKDDVEKNVKTTYTEVIQIKTNTEKRRKYILI